MHVGKLMTAGTSRYAQKEGDSTIYVINSGQSDWAMADVTKFQKPVDGGVSDGGAKDASAAAAAMLGKRPLPH